MGKNIGQPVPPLSTQRIRLFAGKTREVMAVLGAPLTGAINVVDVIDKYLPRLFEKFEYEIRENQDMGTDAARTYPDEYLMEIRSSVYDGAMQGDGFAIFTLGHETGHLLLHRGVGGFAKTMVATAHEIFSDSEWQADSFATEFLMPYEECCSMTSAEEIHTRFGVSYSEAMFRFQDTRKK